MSSESTSPGLALVAGEPRGLSDPWPPARRHPSSASVERLGAVPGDGPAAGTVSFQSVRCPSCSSLDDKVVDSRTADDGSAIRRRRECLHCGRRFTTFERSEELPLSVTKRSGVRVPFDRTKVEAGIGAAAKGRPMLQEQISSMVDSIEEELRSVGPDLTSEQIGRAGVERLRDLDQVAYLRFASVYKGFEGPADFQREVKLLTKATDPKPH